MVTLPTNHGLPPMGLHTGQWPPEGTVNGHRFPSGATVLPVGRWNAGSDGIVPSPRPMRVEVADRA